MDAGDKIEQSIYNEVIVDDIYKIDGSGYQFLIDIGSYKGHVGYMAYNKYADGKNAIEPFFYFGFDPEVEPDMLREFNDGRIIGHYIKSAIDVNDKRSMAMIASADMMIAGYKFLSLCHSDPGNVGRALLKIDIQGAERELLSDEGLFSVHQGANKITSIDSIAFEWHHSDSELNECFATLEKNGFMVESVVSHTDTMTFEPTKIVIAERDHWLS